MNTGDLLLDGLFNNLSSIYRKDNAMLNSNMFVLLNAYATVNNNVQSNINNTKNNTYILNADAGALEDNFGALISFPKPPRLNTISEGNDIYRFMLASMYQYFLSGATISTMETVLENVISLLTTDSSTSTCSNVTNYSTLKFDATSVELTNRAIKCISGVNTSAATVSDITVLPSGDIFITSYDDSIKTISFTGTVNTGTNYSFIYTRDNTGFNNTNWMNLVDRNSANVSPMNLGAGYVNTFNNPEFSYWWSNYNVDGEGVVVNEFQITEEDSSLVYRLPGKSVQFESPFTRQLVLRSYDFYNQTGTVYDLSAPITPTNPDILFSDLPINYQEEVSGRYQNYYVRYNENNPGPVIAQSKFAGNLTKYVKKFNSIEFPSDDFGPLDFFEKNTPTGTSTFSVDDLFGKGTKHAWVDVKNIDGKYILDNTTFAPRYYSLHQNVLFLENFESDTLARIDANPIDGARITEAPGNPIEGAQNCMMLMSLSSGSTTTATPIVTGNIFNVQSGINHIEIDFYDAFNTGTSTMIDVTSTGNSLSDIFQVRFGMDGYLNNVVLPSGTLLNSSSITSSGTLTASAMESVLLGSKNFGFVETYFPSSISSFYAFNVNDGATLNNPSYIVSGTIIPQYSTSSLSGTAPLTLTPRIDNNSIISSDYLLAQFNRQSGSSVAANAIFRRSSFLSSIYSMTSSDSSSNWNLTRIDIEGNFNVSASFSIDTGIPCAPGAGSIELLKDQYLKLNGVIYTGIHNPALEWGTPTSYPFMDSVENIAGDGSDTSFSVSIGAGDSLYHCILGNSTLRNFYFSEIQYQISSITSSETVQNSIAAFRNRPPYYYAIAVSGTNISNVPKVYLTNLPKEKDWHRLTYDFGLNHSNLSLSFDENEILNTPVGFSGNIINPSGIVMTSISNNPFGEFSYFDNVELSYFDKNNLLGIYEVQLQDTDWEGSMLEQSTIVDNKFFQLEPVPNFQFLVTIKGLDESFIYIINNIIDRVKPAHTLAVPIYVLEQSLDTTSQVSGVSNPNTNWESGNISDGIIINIGQKSGITTDLPGFIAISGIAQ